MYNTHLFILLRVYSLYILELLTHGDPLYQLEEKLITSTHISILHSLQRFSAGMSISFPFSRYSSTFIILSSLWSFFVGCVLDYLCSANAVVRLCTIEVNVLWHFSSNLVALVMLRSGAGNGGRRGRHRVVNTLVVYSDQALLDTVGLCTPKSRPFA